jgi:hypothetical protein
MNIPSARLGVRPAFVAQAFRSARARGSRPEGLRHEARASATRISRGVRQTVMTAALVLIAGGARLLACPVCFGAEETSMIDGTRLGIVVMLGITFGVQGAFLGFFLYLRKRARRIAEEDLDNEWSQLQRRTS